MRIARHIIFWLIYLIFWMVIYYRYYTSVLDLLAVTLIYLMAHAGLYYVVQYILIPRLLKQQKLLAFTGAVIGILLFSVLIMFALINLYLGDTFEVFFGENKGILIATLFFANVSTTSVIIAVKSFKDRFIQAREEQRKKTDRLQTELHFLKAQVNPHFLFNTINSIYVLIRKDPDKAAQTLIKLSDLLRTQLYEFGEEKIDIAKELEYIENYMALEKLRKGDQLQLEYNKHADVSGFKIVPLMLIPFLENCYKHLGRSPDGKSVIRIDLKADDEWFYAEFTNSYTRDNHQNQSGGIGLKNVKRRLDLCYPSDQHALDIHEEYPYFTVRLKLKKHV